MSPSSAAIGSLNSGEPSSIGRPAAGRVGRCSSPSRPDRPCRRENGHISVRLVSAPAYSAPTDVHARALRFRRSRPCRKCSSPTVARSRYESSGPAAMPATARSPSTPSPTGTRCTCGWPVCTGRGNAEASDASLRAERQWPDDGAYPVNTMRVEWIAAGWIPAKTDCRNYFVPTNRNPSVRDALGAAPYMTRFATS